MPHTRKKIESGTEPIPVLENYSEYYTKIDEALDIEPIPIFEGYRINSALLENQEDLLEPLPQISEMFEIAENFSFDTKNCELSSKNGNYYRTLHGFLSWCRKQIDSSKQFPDKLKIKLLINQLYFSISDFKDAVRLEIKNDLMLKHYFNLLLKKHEKYVFQTILADTINFIPRSNENKADVKGKKLYSICDDKIQLELIISFIKNIFLIENLTVFGGNGNWNYFLKILNYNKRNLNEYIFIIIDHMVNHFLKNFLYDLNEIKYKNRIYEEFIKFILIVKDDNNHKKSCYKYNKKFKFSRQESRFEIDNLLENANEKGKKIIRASFLNLNFKNESSIFEGVSGDKLNIVEIERQLESPRLLIKKLNEIIFLLDVIVSNSKRNNEKRERALIAKAKAYMLLVNKHDPYTTDHYRYLEEAKTNYLLIPHHKILDSNFILNYIGGNSAKDPKQAIYFYDKAINSNPYFFEAHFQRLLALHEDMNLTQAVSLNNKFSLLQGKSAILNFFQMVCGKNKYEYFLNKIIKAKIKNNSKANLYLKFVIYNGDYYICCNDKDNFVLLLQHGKKSIRLTKKKKVLVNNYNEHEFLSIVDSIKENENKLEENIKQYISHFSNLHLIGDKFLLLKRKITVDEINELLMSRYGHEKILIDHINFLITLPDSRKTLIGYYFSKKSYVNANNNISNSINEYQEILNFCDFLKNILKNINNNKNKLNLLGYLKSKSRVIRGQVLYLRLKRAAIYNKLGLINCEANELLSIVECYAGKNNDFPFVYYRLAIINKMKGDLEKFILYINFCKKRYFNKTNKKIFKKVLAQEYLYNNTYKKNAKTINSLELFRLQRIIENIKSTSNDCDKPILENLHNIGVQFYPDGIDDFSTLYDCLSIGLFDESQKNSSEQLISIDNLCRKNSCQIQLIPIEGDLLEISNKSIPVLFIFRNGKYKIVKGLDKHKYANFLLMNNKNSLYIKEACKKILYRFTKKSFIQDISWFSEKIVHIYKNIINIKTIKGFYETIICFQNNHFKDNAWLSLADLEFDINLKEILVEFKKTFKDSIDEFKEEENKKMIDILNKKASIKNEFDKNEFVSKIQKELLIKLTDKKYTQGRFNELMDILSDKNDRDKISDIMRVLDLEITPEIKSHINANEMLKISLFDIIEKALEKSKLITSLGQVVLDGYNVILSDYLNDLEKILMANAHITKIIINAAHVTFDKSLISKCWHGKDLVVNTQTMVFDSNIIIDVSGVSGKDGENAKAQSHATRPGESGKDGHTGGNGSAGQNGGDVIFMVQNEIRNKAGLIKLNVSGGEGGRGGNGGNGGDGMKGTDGINGKTDEPKYGHISDGYYRFSRGTKGTSGGDGGNGGAAGVGAYGGVAGQVLIKENENDIADKFDKAIINIDKSSVAAQDGKPGEGGKGATGGVDGLDELRVKTGFWRKMQVHNLRNIKITKRGKRDTLLDEEVPLEWTYDDRSDEILRKNNQGKNGEQGLAADKQLSSTLQRNKSAVKEHNHKNQLASKQAINAQLQEIIEENKTQNALALEKITIQSQAQQHVISMLDSAITTINAHELNSKKVISAQQNILRQLNAHSNLPNKLAIKTNSSAAERFFSNKLKKVSGNDDLNSLKLKGAKIKQKILHKLTDNIKKIDVILIEKKKAVKVSFEDYYFERKQVDLETVGIEYSALLKQLNDKKKILSLNKQAILNYEVILEKLDRYCTSTSEIKIKLQKLHEILTQYKEPNMISMLARFEDELNVFSDPFLDNLLMIPKN